MTKLMLHVNYPLFFRRSQDLFLHIFHLTEPVRREPLLKGRSKNLEVLTSEDVKETKYFGHSIETLKFAIKILP